MRSGQKAASCAFFSIRFLLPFSKETIELPGDFVYNIVWVKFEIQLNFNENKEDRYESSYH